MIDELQKNELNKIKLKRKISNKEDIKEIVEHPERFFDEESVDFTVFYSDRVKEIGVYKPRFYPFVCPYKSIWIPGIVIKDRVHGEKRVYFKTSHDLDEFISEKNLAQHTGKEFFEWQGAEIPIDDAEKFIRIANKQFDKPDRPIDNIENSNENQVLIIK